MDEQDPMRASLLWLSQQSPATAMNRIQSTVFLSEAAGWARFP